MIPWLLLIVFETVLSHLFSLQECLGYILWRQWILRLNTHCKKLLLVKYELGVRMIPIRRSCLNQISVVPAALSLCSRLWFWRGNSLSTLARIVSIFPRWWSSIYWLDWSLQEGLYASIILSHLLLYLGTKWLSCYFVCCWLDQLSKALLLSLNQLQLTICGSRRW